MSMSGLPPLVQSYTKWIQRKFSLGKPSSPASAAASVAKVEPEPQAQLDSDASVSIPKRQPFVSDHSVSIPRKLPCTPSSPASSSASPSRQEQPALSAVPRRRPCTPASSAGTPLGPGPVACWGLNPPTEGHPEVSSSSRPCTSTSFPSLSVPEDSPLSAGAAMRHCSGGSASS